MKKSIFTFCLLAISLMAFADQKHRLIPISPISNNQLHEATLMKERVFGIHCDHLPSDKSEGLSFSYETMNLSYSITIPLEQNKGNLFATNKYQMKLSKEHADAIFSLITAAICSASEKEESTPIFDGTPFYLNISQYYGTFKVPEDASNCYRLESIIYTLMKCTKEQTPTIIDENMDEIKALTNEFIKLYETNPQEKQEIFDLHKKYRVKGSAMNLVF